MKHVLSVSLALLTLLALPFDARAEITLDGRVECGASVVQMAYVGGKLGSVNALVGDYVYRNDVIATLKLTPVYAPLSGTVEAVFAAAGESADEAVEHYGCALTIAPESLFTVYATTESAYDSVRTSHISSGQPVYLKCAKDGTHRGVGRITRIEGNTFEIETTGGAFYNGEAVYVYMESDFSAEDRVGKGTVLATESEAVAASGDVAQLYVRPGDFVEKGQLLMETLGELPDVNPLRSRYTLAAETEGYVRAIYVQANKTVERGDLVAEICPQAALVVAAKVYADDLALVDIGQAVTVCFDLSDETLRLPGRIEAISFLAQTGTSLETAYTATVSFQTDPRVRPGMSATVEAE